jgi:RNA polymerase sigma-70 factor (ECF subfamily)
MELLERFTRGELEAFETLFRQYQGEVYGWIVRMVRNPALAEDLTIETFWRIYRAHARFDPARSFGAWARRIATNVAIDHLKSARHEVELPSDVRAPAQADPAARTEMQAAIAVAFRALPTKLQAAATLALVEERPQEEVGEALGISASAVKSRVFRATRLLRKKLQRMGFEP